MFVAMVVVPTPPLGLNTATSRVAARVADRREPTGPDLRSLEAQRERLDPRLAAPGRSNGLAMTSSAPASRSPIRSSRSSVWAMARTGIVAVWARPAQLLDDIARPWRAARPGR